MSVRTPRLLLTTGLGSLVLALLLGGVALATVEGLAFKDGLWLSYNVVSTTGFGPGPATASGRLISLGLFGWAVLSYAMILMGVSFQGFVLADQRRRGHLLGRQEVQQLADELNRN